MTTRYVVLITIRFIVVSAGERHIVVYRTIDHVLTDSLPVKIVPPVKLGSHAQYIRFVCAPMHWRRQEALASVVLVKTIHRDSNMDGLQKLTKHAFQSLRLADRNRIARFGKAFLSIERETTHREQWPGNVGCRSAVRCGASSALRCTIPGVA